MHTHVLLFYLLPPLMVIPLLQYLHLDEVTLLVPSAVSSRRGRLVTQDLLDPLVELGVELGQDLESLDILVNLFRLGSSELPISAHLIQSGRGLTIQVETFLLEIAQARAKLLMFVPISSAILVKSLTFWSWALPSSLCKNLAFSEEAPWTLTANRDPSGRPSLYLPVRIPCSRGDQMVLPVSNLYLAG
jgi:hypothetical protein